MDRRQRVKKASCFPRPRLQTWSCFYLLKIKTLNPLGLPVTLGMKSKLLLMSYKLAPGELQLLLDTFPSLCAPSSSTRPSLLVPQPGPPTPQLSPENCCSLSGSHFSASPPNPPGWIRCRGNWGTSLPNSAFRGAILVACSWPWWYLNHGNQHMLHIRVPLPPWRVGCYAFTTHCWVAVDAFDLVLPWGSGGLLASPHRPVLVAYLCVNLPHQTELPEGRVPQGSQPKCSLWLEHVPLRSFREQVSHGSFTRVTEWGGATWQAGPASTPHFYSL